MRDYTLAVGSGQPYGFSAADDRGATLHVVDYLAVHAPGRLGETVPMVLIGPDGLLSQPDEDAAGFCRRVKRAHPVENTDDVRVADSTPPDCNTI
jgi:hypothetical protein